MIVAVPLGIYTVLVAFPPQAVTVIMLGKYFVSVEPGTGIVVVDGRYEVVKTVMFSVVVEYLVE